jgi:hypothetical protein
VTMARVLKEKTKKQRIGKPIKRKPIKENL